MSDVGIVRTAQSQALEGTQARGSLIGIRVLSNTSFADKSVIKGNITCQPKTNCRKLLTLVSKQNQLVIVNEITTVQYAIATFSRLTSVTSQMILLLYLTGVMLVKLVEIRTLTNIGQRVLLFLVSGSPRACGLTYGTDACAQSVPSTTTIHKRK